MDVEGGRGRARRRRSTTEGDLVQRSVAIRSAFPSLSASTTLVHADPVLPKPLCRRRRSQKRETPPDPAFPPRPLSEPIALLSLALTTRALAQLRSMSATLPEPATLLRAFLRVMFDEIVPKTRANVASGSKVFGASVHRKSDLSAVTVGTNTETESPLLVRPSRSLAPQGKEAGEVCEGASDERGGGGR